MIYRFGGCRLDVRRCELRSGGDLVPVEPQVLSLLIFLIENRERLVSRDEIVEHVWKGRIVSEAAIASRMKSARKAIGDDGSAQRLIRTVPKLGFRFVGEVEILSTPPAPTSAASAPAITDPLGARPSLAVLPFAARGCAASEAWVADALPHDLIVELSRLRWLFVIARGSSFRFRRDDVDIDQVRQALKVRYCLTGVLAAHGPGMTVTVELCDTAESSVVWSESFRFGREGVHEVRAEIVQAVIAALELQIPQNEARRAHLKPPERLDAWSAYHLGLQQMYRFSRGGNAQAAALFEQAIAIEPGFARAHAALSFTHFESAFLGFTHDQASAGAEARRFAETSLELDPLDPFGNLVMGRVFWLGGELETSLSWLDRALRLNPNYAQAKYARGWAETLLGEGAAGQANVDAALQLSPLDPLAYGMLGVRAFSHIVLDEPEQAAAWGDQAARAPGAHALIEMIAAVAHELNGDETRARSWAASARRRHRGLTSQEFLAAFPFRDPAARRRIVGALERLSA